MRHPKRPLLVATLALLTALAPVTVLAHPGEGPHPAHDDNHIPRGVVLDRWQAGDPVPVGYVQDTQIRKGLVISGASILGGFWVASIIAGAFGSALEADNNFPDTVNKSDWIPMFVPVIGPFISIATLETGEIGTTFLVLDGLLQTGGMTMLILGIVLKRTTLRPVMQVGDVDLQLMPVSSQKFTGLTLNGTF